jgi:hypothetical protein
MAFLKIVQFGELMDNVQGMFELKLMSKWQIKQKLNRD